MKPRTIITTAALLTLAAATCLAFTTPATTDFAYYSYDVGINKILKGPIGFTAGCGLLTWAFANVFYNGSGTTGGYFMGQVLMKIVGGVAILKADTLVTALGIVL